MSSTCPEGYTSTMASQEKITNQELTDLDLYKVPALHQKRTLAFVNHFVITTVQFLNNFMKKCEHSLIKFERKLEKVEAAMVLLETRLSSIPEINNSQSETKLVIMPEAHNAEQKTDHESENMKVAKNNPETTKQHLEESQQNTETIKHNAEQVQLEYERFVKMVQVGVPLEAVKLKVSLEGLDPNVLVKILGK